ncbi:MAG: hypothetical protein K0R21_1380 [Anaerocolumna sp.]|nr:hypothetical protein [Anaerocolumna sp.]
MNKSKKRKQKIITWIALLIFMIIGGIFGFLGALYIDKNLNMFSDNLWTDLLMEAALIASVILIFYVHIIVHEGGHFIFGKLSGYKFLSFRIGSLTIVSDNNKYKLKRFKIAGTGGQCLMMPPESDGYHYPYILYNLGGVIANIVVSILCLIFYWVQSSINLFSILLIVSIFLGLILAFTNALPLKIGGVANDGYNVYYLRKDEEARRAFGILLKVNGLLTTGTRLRDMPSDWFELPPNADLNNHIISSIRALKCSYLHDKMQFAEAKALIEDILENVPNLLIIYQNELRCELLFYEIIGQCREDVIQQLYTKELKKYIKVTASYASKRRLLYAYALLVENNEKKAQKELAAFEKIVKTSPYKADIESEKEMIALIQER